MWDKDPTSGSLPHVLPHYRKFRPHSQIPMFCLSSSWLASQTFYYFYMSFLDFLHDFIYMLTSSHFHTVWEPGAHSLLWDDFPLPLSFKATPKWLWSGCYAAAIHFGLVLIYETEIGKLNLSFLLLFLRSLSYDRTCGLRKELWSTTGGDMGLWLTCLLVPHSWQNASSQIYQMSLPFYDGMSGLALVATWWIW